MKKFIVLYHSTNDAMSQMANTTPEQQKAGMEGWMQWAQRCGSHLVEMGSPLMGGKVLHSNGSSDPSSKGVSGYSILQANDIAHATELLQGHPHLMHGGCSIELHETMPIPGM